MFIPKDWFVRPSVYHFLFFRLKKTRTHLTLAAYVFFFFIFYRAERERAGPGRPLGMCMYKGKEECFCNVFLWHTKRNKHTADPPVTPPSTILRSERERERQDCHLFPLSVSFLPSFHLHSLDLKKKIKRANLRRESQWGFIIVRRQHPEEVIKRVMASRIIT